MNRLVRENVVDGNITVYKYDDGGNIQYKKVFPYSSYAGNNTSTLLNSSSGTTVNYVYGTESHKDLLTSYNGSETLEYDDCGKPKKWFKHSNSGSALKFDLNWEHVSNLTGITDEDSGVTCAFEYNDQGIRTKKIANGLTHQYYLNGENIIGETRIFGIMDTKLRYYYDATGVCGFNYNGTDYYYQKNQQGDILRIYDGSGTLYAEYAYDAWGKCSIKTNVNSIAMINPFRYRGYYYDIETNLYYLNSRYYDPEIGRFISQDSTDYLAPKTINGLNLYAYCGNNPVMGYDPSGTWDWKYFWSVVADFAVTLVALVVGIAVGVSAGTVEGIATAASVTAQTGNAALGAVVGAAVGVGSGLLTFSAINNGVNAIYYSLTDGSNALPKDWKDGQYSNDSYQQRYITRWERLDTAKVYAENSAYWGNAQRFYAEYTLHMYGWYLTGWAYNKNIPKISEYIGKFSSAEVFPNAWDSRWYVNLFTVLFMVLGI